MKKIILLLSVIYQCLVNTSCNQAQSQTNNVSEKAFKIDSLLQLYNDYDGFNGSVLVSHEGETILKKGYGYANMQWDIPNDVNTKFQIGSITKPFTAILVLQLVNEGKLDLHEPISTYLPNFPKENGDRITIHHLLTHSSGIVREGVNDKKQNRPEAMVNQFAEMPLDFEPGERFSYSNSGYTLLGYIIETITKESYEDVLNNKILKPLGMDNSGYYRNMPIIKNMSSGYYKGFGDYLNIERSDKSTAYAAGALYSTVEDLQKLTKALQTDALLPNAYRKLMLKKHIEDTDYGGFYGYGFEVLEKPIGNSGNKILTYGHSGTIDGYCALLTIIPSSESSIIFLNNTRRAYLNSMTAGITGILNDTTYNFPRKPLAQFMSKKIDEVSLEEGILFYKKHKNDSDYYINEVELIVEGYRYLQSGNAEYAAEVFKLSTEVFPDKDNPYDSYAEALMVLGKNEEAIINYKKSLALNPNNYNAEKMLKKLENL